MVRHEPLFHTDVTPYAELPLDGASQNRHFRIYTLWRNCDPEHPVRTMPLAVSLPVCATCARSCPKMSCWPTPWIEQIPRESATAIGLCIAARRSGITFRQ